MAFNRMTTDRLKSASSLTPRSENQGSPTGKWKGRATSSTDCYQSPRERKEPTSCDAGSVSLPVRQVTKVAVGRQTLDRLEHMPEDTDAPTAYSAVHKFGPGSKGPSPSGADILRIEMSSLPMRQVNTVALSPKTLGRMRRAHKAPTPQLPMRQVNMVTLGHRPSARWSICRKTLKLRLPIRQVTDGPEPESPRPDGTGTRGHHCSDCLYGRLQAVVSDSRPLDRIRRAPKDTNTPAAYSADNNLLITQSR